MRLIDHLRLMKKYAVLFLTFLLFACNAMDGKDQDPREKLKAAMIDALYKAVNYDSSKVKYRIEEVIYYEDTKYYDCQFKLTMMRSGNTDTTGSVWAFISKDFKEVKRTF